MRKPCRRAAGVLAPAILWMVALTLWVEAGRGVLAKAVTMHGAHALPLWGSTGAMKRLYNRIGRVGPDYHEWSDVTGQDLNHEMDGYSWQGITAEDLSDIAGYHMTPGSLMEIDIGEDRIIGQALAELVTVGELTEQGARASLSYLAGSGQEVGDTLQISSDPLRFDPVEVHFCSGLARNEYRGVEEECPYRRLP